MSPGWKAVVRDQPDWVNSSAAFGCTPPILAGANDWNIIDALHIKKITIDTDE
jgi:hypothetical protein